MLEILDRLWVKKINYKNEEFEVKNIQKLSEVENKNINMNELLDLSKKIKVEEENWRINKITTYNVKDLYKTQPDKLTYKWLKNVVDSIKQNGYNVNEPVIIYVDNGKPLIVEWHHRFEAAKLLGYRRIPIKYIHKNQIKKYGRTLEELRALAFK